MKIIIQLIVVISIIIILSLTSAFYILNSSTPNIPYDGVEFEIKIGDNSHSVANRLKTQGYIKSKLFFISIIKISDLGNKLRPGWIKINSHDTTFKIIRTIFNGVFITVKFTIPEGYTLKQINELLVKEKIVSQEDIDSFFADPNYTSKVGLDDFDNIEGFLFPETYKVNKGTKPGQIFYSMVELFFDKLSTINPSYQNLSKKELYQKVIMASIIEKEVKNHSESEIVAGVFYNRIEQHQKLQSCATVQYVLGKPKERLLEEDLLIDSPYNTYINLGLPPSPISNPGLNSLKAAFYPKKHNFLFFVVKNPAKGTHHFSETYQEHLLAQQRYKKIKGFY